MRGTFRIAAIFGLGVVAGAGIIALLPRFGGLHIAVAPEAAKAPQETPGRVRLDAAAQKNIGLRVERAQMRSVERVVEATGVVRPNDSRLARVRPLARGRIQKVHVRLGDRVRAGQTLLLYDNIELGEMVGQYTSGLAVLDKAMAEAEMARRSVDRAKALVDVGALAKAEFDRRSAEHSNALSSIAGQAADLAKTEEKLHRFGLSEEDVKALNSREGAGGHREFSLSRLTAPFDGIVIEYNVAEGETFGPEDVAFSIADLSTAWVLADVYEKDIAQVRAARDARIVLDAYPEEVFTGRITYVSDFLDPKTRTAKVRCEVPNHDGKLKIDMFATVQLPTPAGGQVLVVPAAAVQQVDDRPLLFVRASDTEFEPRHVQLGARMDGWVEIASGIREGETVASHGSFFLKSTLLRSRIGGEE